MSEAQPAPKAYMDYTVGIAKAFVVITGEIGAQDHAYPEGLSELDENVLSKIFQTQLYEVEFLQAMLVDFGLNPFMRRKLSCSTCSIPSYWSIRAGQSKSC